MPKNNTPIALRKLQIIARHFGNAHAEGHKLLMVRSREKETLSIGVCEETKGAREAFRELAINTEPLLVALDVGYEADHGATAEGRLINWVFQCLATDKLPTWDETEELRAFKGNAFERTQLALEWLIAELEPARAKQSEPPNAKASSGKRIGRPRVRDDLWRFIVKYGAERACGTDKAIAAAYNQVNGRAIGEGLLTKATAKSVANARYRHKQDASVSEMTPTRASLAARNYPAKPRNRKKSGS